MTLDIRELLRRLRAGEPVRAVARDLCVARKTAQRYRDLAEGQGWLEGPLPPIEVLDRVLQDLEPKSTLSMSVFKAVPWKAQIEALRDQKVEIRAILGRLRPLGYDGSYSALYRFVVHLEGRTPEGFCRVETVPGEEAQVDFGYGGLMKDPETGVLRKTWFFVMTLSYSRHQFVRFVFDQSIGTWLHCHRQAFEAFGGVPTRIKVDNLKSAIVKATLHDPEASRSYREFAEHYDFLISPCRPRVPRHKGKVESGVHYVKRNFLAGRTFRDLHHANAEVERWVEEVAGVRLHGTIQDRPLARFLTHEREALRPLPTVPHDQGVWKRAKLHPDCHLVVGGAYYSAPHRFIGQRLWVRATSREICIFHEHDRVATHPWGPRGTRRTEPIHYPPHKVAALMATPRFCREQAERIGPSAVAVVERLLDHRPLDRLRAVQAILRLAQKHGEPRLELACRRALCFDDPRYVTIKRILVKGLDGEPLPSTFPRLSEAGPVRRNYAFVRPGSEIFFNRGGTDHGSQAPVDPQAQGLAALGHLGDVGCA
ncbi:MAG: IS21 family transposase [Candidatus Eisenbacteria bacterium]|nr:IS21 family transposase [Candidatus Eisenbacteria bacterium]